MITVNISESAISSAGEIMSKFNMVNIEKRAAELKLINNKIDFSRD